MTDPTPITESPLYALFNEQLLLIATIVGAIATLPALFEFVMERRKRAERVRLSLDDVPVSEVPVRIAGMDALIESIRDLIDCVRDPSSYASHGADNEMLIIGPHLSGKKTLAMRIAQLCNVDRIITVYNPRNADALSEAKRLIKGYRRQRLLLLLPRLDLVVEREDDEALFEIDALIETTSEMNNVLVVGTAVKFYPTSVLDNLFGVILTLPGAQVESRELAPLSSETHSMIAEVARYYLGEALKSGFKLKNLSQSDFVERILETARNPADVEDIVVLCQTQATYQKKLQQGSALEITPQALELAIGRVTLGASR